MFGKLIAPAVALLSLFWPKERRAVALLFNAHQGVDGNLAAMAHYLAARDDVSLYFLDHRGEGVREEVPRFNARYAKRGSMAEFLLRMKCRRYIISHSHKPLRGMYGLIPGNVIVNVWHGIPIKGMGNLDAHFRRKNVPKLFNKNRRLSAFTVSSELERALIAGCFFIDASRIAVTGMPRLDALLVPEAELPDVVQDEVRQLRALLDGRRLVLYAPTFRDYDRKATGFAAKNFSSLGAVLTERNAVLGVRPHPRDAGLYDELLADAPFALDLSSRRFSEPAALMREADVLVSDYSSIWIEYLLMQRPVVAWAWDRARYQDRRGLMMDLDSVFPGPVVTSAADLEGALVEALDRPEASCRQVASVEKLFHRHRDSRNTERVWALVQRLSG